MGAFSLYKERHTRKTQQTTFKKIELYQRIPQKKEANDNRLPFIKGLSKLFGLLSVSVGALLLLAF